MSAMSSWPASDRNYGPKSGKSGKRHGGRRVGKFNDMQEQFAKMTNWQRTNWFRKEKRKREEKKRATEALRRPRDPNCAD